jgi:hypothetical protein
MNTQEISDSLEIKSLVEWFSNYADTRENKLQSQLFTEDGQVNIINNGQIPFTLNGQSEIETTFRASMAEFDSIFHMSGQQTVTFIDETHATGIAYTLVVLTKGEVVNQGGVRYEDTYEKISGKWLIKQRNSNFKWQKAIGGEE